MNFQELTKLFCKRFYIPRRVDGHKGTFGKVLIMAGSEAYPGAGSAGKRFFWCEACR